MSIAPDHTKDSNPGGWGQVRILALSLSRLLAAYPAYALEAGGLTEIASSERPEDLPEFGEADLRSTLRRAFRSHGPQAEDTELVHLAHSSCAETLGSLAELAADLPAPDKDLGAALAYLGATCRALALAAHRWPSPAPVDRSEDVPAVSLDAALEEAAGDLDAADLPEECALARATTFRPINRQEERDLEDLRDIVQKAGFDPEGAA